MSLSVFKTTCAKCCLKTIEKTVVDQGRKFRFFDELMSFTAFTGSLEVNGLSGQEKKRCAEFDQLVAIFKER